jgi:transcriptional regulator with XRE-family HTH domain
MPRQGPDPRDRAIGATLAEKRKGEQISQAELARRLGWTGSKLSRIESGLRRIELEDVAAILAVLGIGGQERDDLIEQVKRPRTSGWWERRLPGLPPEAGTLAAYQQDASKLTNWAPNVVPGLLQTRAYATDLMTKMRIAEHDISLRWMVRLQRQEVLQRQGVTYTAILGEAALKTPFGDPAAFRAQLRRIREAADEHTVLIVPEYTPTPALLSAWLLMEFPEASNLAPVAHGELVRSAIFLVNEEAGPYLEERDALLSLAVGAKESRTLIDRALGSFE